MALQCSYTGSIQGARLGMCNEHTSQTCIEGQTTDTSQTCIEGQTTDTSQTCIEGQTTGRISRLVM